MPQVQSPKANPENLLSIVRDAYDAKVVVPEFQRSFVWSREDVEELLESVIQGYFIGTFLILDTSTDNPMFPFRAVEGLEHVNGAASPARHPTVRLVLDGQQRITSMFYAVYGPDIPLRGSKYPHRFFIILEDALRGDIVEAVVGVSTRDQQRMSLIQRLVDADKALPFTRFRESGAFYKWLYKEQQAWPEDEQRQAIEELFHRFSNFMVPVVALSAETGKDNIVNIFERINRTGVSLSLFDLLAARLYLKGLKLRDLWEAFRKQYKSAADVVRPEFVVKVIALIEGKEPRKGTLLDVLDALDAEAFRARWREAADALNRAYERITRYYGSIGEAWIPYTTITVPLAVVLYHIAKTKAGEDAYSKVDRWYWASVLSQRYDSAVDTKTYQDVRDVGEWVRNDIVPAWLQQVKLEPGDFDIEEQRSAIYRGIMNLIARRGARDFLTGQPIDLSKCQDDHIFPKALYKKFPLTNTVINRTLISRETNNFKGDMKPSEFLRKCLEKRGGDESALRDTLSSHFITDGAYEAMRRDDIEAFFEHRRRALQKAAEAVLRGEHPSVGT